MLKKIREKIIVPSVIQCIELHFSAIDKYSISLLTIKKTRSEYFINAFSEGISSIQELLKIIDVSVPVIINLNGKIIVDKKIRYKEGESESELLKSTLPNASNSEFLIQKHSTVLEGFALVSVVRKKTVDEILTELYGHKFIILEINFGSFSISSLFPYLNIKNNFIFNGFRYLYNENKLTDVVEDIDEQKEELILNFSGHILLKTYFIPLATVVGFYRNFSDINSPVQKVKDYRSEFINKKLSKVLAFFSLGTILLILLINFIYFSHLTEISNQLISDKGQDQEILIKYENLKKEVNEKSKLIDAIGLKSTQGGSFYADEIAASVPENITLSEMNFQPILFNSGSHDKTDIGYKSISVSGNCTGSITLNDWVKKMKSRDWCGNITISNYNFDTEKNQAKFLLTIKLK